ncbi:MAG: flagellar hook-length control protein FliK [Oscillospiraceae bacterium]|nr:flagellar hook-length control protein FliK [Oscillospiraceae bacterium]
MSELTALQLNQPAAAPAEKSNQKKGKDADFSEIFSKASQRNVSSNEDVAAPSRPEQPKIADRGDRDKPASKPEKNEPPVKREREKPAAAPAEELVAYANNAQAANNTPIAEEKQDTAPAVEDIVSAPVKEVEIVTDIPDVKDSVKADSPANTEPNPVVTKMPEQDLAAQLSVIEPPVALDTPPPVMAAPLVATIIEEINPVQDIPEDSAVAALSQAAEILDLAEIDGETIEVVNLSSELAVPTDEELEISQEVKEAAEDFNGRIQDKYKDVNELKNILAEIEAFMEGLDETSDEYALIKSIMEKLTEDIQELEDSANKILAASPVQAAIVQNYAPVPGSIQAVLQDLVSNVQNIFQQVANSAAMTAPGTKSQLVMQLYPEHLGKLRIELTADMAGRISARFECENSAVRAIFNDCIRDLSDCLKAAGVDLKDIEILRLESTLSDSDLGHRSNLQQDNQNRQNQYYSAGRRRTVSNVINSVDVSPMAALYETAILNTLVEDESKSVDFSA